MEPVIKTLTEKKLVGLHMKMTLSDNRTGELWRNFMLRRKDIKNNLSSVLYSLQVYDKSFDFVDFKQDIPFEKWAAVEVNDFTGVPSEMETFILTGGLYAVFYYKGAFQVKDLKRFNTFLEPGCQILNTWLTTGHTLNY